MFSRQLRLIPSLTSRIEDKNLTCSCCVFTTPRWFTIPGGPSSVRPTVLAIASSTQFDPSSSEQNHSQPIQLSLHPHTMFQTYNCPWPVGHEPEYRLKQAGTWLLDLERDLEDLQERSVFPVGRYLEILDQ